MSDTIERKKASNISKQEKKCLQCKDNFIQTRKTRIFCSTSCRFKYWNERHPRVKLNE
jgi:hypothetical protein